MKQWASAYAQMGLRVHPLNGKIPLWKGWPDKATSDLGTVAAVWDAQPLANIGVVTGRYGERYLLVIDGDKPHGNNAADGTTTIVNWQMIHGAFPETATAQTAHGGIHYYFWVDSPYRNKTGLHPGVDIRCENGFVGVPPNMMDGLQYQWLKAPWNTPIAPANSAVLAFLDPAKETTSPAAQGSYSGPYSMPESVGEGQRTTEMIKLVGSLQSKGLSDAAIRAAVYEENESRCNPPLSDEELESTVFPSLGRWQKGTAPYTADRMRGSNEAWLIERLKSMHPETQYGWHDAGNGNLFADLSRDVCRYVVERKKWYFFDGKRWVPDLGGLQTMDFCKEVASALLVYATRQTFTDEKRQMEYIKHAAKWQQLHYRETILKDAATVNPLPLSTFDSKDYLLNCPNGTLDMRIGQFREHRSEDYITQLAGVSYDPAATSPRWEQFMREITCGDEQLARFIQKALGYALTGDTRYECFFLLYGATTRNGKGTLCETFMRLMGDYGCSANPESLATRNYNDSRAPSEDIARLAGKRFANFSEPSKKMVLSVDMVKKLTGSSSETVTARFLGENSFSFKPRFKIFMDTNHLPTVTDATLFSSDRVNVIPFNRHFAEHERDASLKAKLTAPESLSGILNWCLEGLRLLRSEKLQPPAAVKAATRSYEEDTDRIGQFISETLVSASDGEVEAQIVHQLYQDWCNRSGCYAEGFPEFKKTLETAGIRTKRKRPKGGKANDGKRCFVLGYTLNK